MCSATRLILNIMMYVHEKKRSPITNAFLTTCSHRGAPVVQRPPIAYGILRVNPGPRRGSI